LVNLGFSKKVKIATNQFIVGLQVNNLLNTEYKEYMNRFRYFTADMGRNILLKINYQF
jgi:iron complex outermembrane receptor protein